MNGREAEAQVSDGWSWIAGNAVLAADTTRVAAATRSLTPLEALSVRSAG
jgi:hypothetical protein